MLGQTALVALLGAAAVCTFMSNSFQGSSCGYTREQVWAISPRQVRCCSTALKNPTLSGTMGYGREEEEHGHTGKKDPP